MTDPVVAAPAAPVVATVVVPAVVVPGTILTTAVPILEYLITWLPTLLGMAAVGFIASYLGADWKNEGGFIAAFAAGALFVSLCAFIGKVVTAAGVAAKAAL